MEILKTRIDSIKTEKSFSFVVKTPSGIEITMYGEIINDEVSKSSTNPSFWNNARFRELDEMEQNQIIKLVNSELLKLINYKY